MIQVINDSDYPFSKATAGAAGYDVVCNQAGFSLAPGDRKLVRTGIRLQMPQDYACLVIPRSGWANKFGITVTNSPGLIDSDYRGEVCVILQNTGTAPFAVTKGDRIAQLLFIRTANQPLEFVQELDDSERGEGGFGSTGS